MQILLSESEKNLIENKVKNRRHQWDPVMFEERSDFFINKKEAKSASKTTTN